MNYFDFAIARVGSGIQNEDLRHTNGNGFGQSQEETTGECSGASGGFEDETTSAPNVQKIGYDSENIYTPDFTLTEKEMGQQNVISYSRSPQHQQSNHLSQIPLPATSHTDVGVLNSSPVVSSNTKQPQQPLSQLQQGLQRDSESSQPQEFQSKTPGDESRQDDRLREQQHSIDMLMAKELNQLSFRQRNEINEEIHGVSSLYSVEETDELIDRSLENLRFEVEHNVPMHRKVAYVRSQQIYKRNLQLHEQQQHQLCLVSSMPVNNSRNTNNNGTSSSLEKPNGYINDRDFLLLFLRRELFTIRKAALRLVNFMELVYELWGERALTEKLWRSQSNLSSIELDFFRKGIFQCLQGRDRAGRRILGNFADDASDLSVHSRVSAVLLKIIETPCFIRSINFSLLT